MRWWDRRTCTVTRKISFDNPITSMELSSQTQRLVVTSGNMVAFIPAQPAEMGAPAHSLSLPYAPSSASIHPIWKDRFVTGSTSDEWVRIHGINGEEWDVLKGHHGPVHCVEYSPDGEVYASGSGACKHVYNWLFTSAEKFCHIPFFLFHWSIRGRYVYSYQFDQPRPFIPAQVPSDCGRPHQGRLTAFGKELPPTEASLRWNKKLISGSID